MAVVAGERPIAERGVGEQIGGRHRHDQTCIGQGLLKIAHNLVTLGGRGINRHKVVVVEVDPVGADFAQEVDDFDGGKGVPHSFAKGVTAGIADGPEAKSKFVFGLRGIHGCLCSCFIAVQGGRIGV